jgi:hypothetical protein
MANVEVTKIEEQRNCRLLFRVRVGATAGQMEFPIAVQEQGSMALNEAAVLRTPLAPDSRFLYD